MIRRNTWILLAVFVVLLGVFLYLQRTQPAEEAEATLPAPVYLFDTTEKDIQRLALTSSGGDSLEVARGEGDAWTLVQPADEPADAARIEAAVLQAESLQIVTELENPPEAEVVGLAPAAYQITVTLDDGQQQTASIGDETPTGNGYYARLEGGPVIVVARPTVETLVGWLENPPVAPTPPANPTLEGTGTVTPGAGGTETPAATATP